jgi:hypothetical protein
MLRRNSVSSELVSKEPEQKHQRLSATTPRGAHPWVHAFGQPGERVIRGGKGWSVRVIHFPTGPEVVAVEGPLADQWKELYARLLRQGFRPEQATALLVLKSQQMAEGDLLKREQQQRRLAYVRYLVESGRLNEGELAPEKIAAREQALAVMS